VTLNNFVLFHLKLISLDPVKLKRRDRKRLKWLALKSSKALEAASKASKGQQKQEQKFGGHWSCLPDLILEKIFQYLEIKVS